MEKILKPYVDVVFKYIFGSEENKNEVLLNFINEIIKETEPILFTDLTLLNPFIDKDSLLDKQSILDIRAKNKDGKQVNVEIQVLNTLGMKKRTLYYWSKLYEQQLAQGDLYISLNKTITINILNFTLFEDTRLHHKFHIYDDDILEPFIDDLEIHFLELSKLEKFEYDMRNPLTKWLTFIKGVSRNKWEELAMDTPGIKKAMTSLEFFQQDHEARALYEAREKAMLDDMAAKALATLEGQEQGLATGKENAKLEIAKNLLKAGKMSIPEIAQVVELSEDKIRKLK